MISKSIYFFCDHIFREENLLIDFLQKKVLQNNTFLAKHTTSAYLIGIYAYGIT